MDGGRLVLKAGVISWTGDLGWICRVLKMLGGRDGAGGVVKAGAKVEDSMIGGGGGMLARGVSVAGNKYFTFI